MRKVLIDFELLEKTEAAFNSGLSISHDSFIRVGIRAALASPVVQQAQEPVAWRYQDARGNYRYRAYVPKFDVEYKLLKPVPLYAAPAVQQPLTGYYKTIEDVLTFARDVNEPSPEMIEQAIAALRNLQAPHLITDEQCEAIYTSLNEWARDVDHYDFGLPMNDTDKPIGLEVIKNSAHGIGGQQP